MRALAQGRGTPDRAICPLEGARGRAPAEVPPRHHAWQREGGPRERRAQVGVGLRKQLRHLSVHLDRERGPRPGVLITFPLLLTSGCLPPGPPHSSSPCLSTHPSICLSAADLCPHCVAGVLAPAPHPGWVGPVALCKEPAAGPRVPLGRGLVAALSMPPSSELGRPAGKAAGLPRGQAVSGVRSRRSSVRGWGRGLQRQAMREEGSHPCLGLRPRSSEAREALAFGPQSASPSCQPLAHRAPRGRLPRPPPTVSPAPASLGLVLSRPLRSRVCLFFLPPFPFLSPFLPCPFSLFSLSSVLCTQAAH